MIQIVTYILEHGLGTGFFSQIVTYILEHGLGTGLLSVTYYSDNKKYKPIKLIGYNGIMLYKKGE